MIDFISYANNNPTDEFLELQQEISSNRLRADEHFKIRPGHRNLILNLMAEVEKSDFNELISQCKAIQFKIPEQAVQNQLYNEVEDEEIKLFSTEEYVEDSQGEDAVEEATEEDEYILEEYVVEEMNEKPHFNYIESCDEIDGNSWLLNRRNFISRKERDSSSDKKKTRRPEHMYNDEFLATNSNPRKRRLKKFYDETDEGIKQRFIDMLSQSLECILPRDLYEIYRDAELEVKKMKENSWTATCPICKFLVRLPIVPENNGRYINYKRSNFERHLRFKHC